MDHVDPELPNDVRMPDRIRNYLLVAKPGIIFGNLISAAAGFFLASRGRIDCVALAATLLGISLVVAAGGVFNNCVDREIDRQMTRTRNRALAQGRISLGTAISYATLLGLAGLVLLLAATNLLTVAHRAGGPGDLCGGVQPVHEAQFRLRRPGRQPGGSHTAPWRDIAPSPAASTWGQ